MKAQKAIDVIAPLGGQPFAKLVKGLLAVPPAELAKARKADQEHKHGRKND